MEAAETDTEKFAALFLVPKLVRGTDCDKNARMCIMKVCSICAFSKTKYVLFLLDFTYGILEVFFTNFYRALVIHFWQGCCEVKTVRMDVQECCSNQLPYRYLAVLPKTKKL